MELQVLDTKYEVRSTKLGLMQGVKSRFRTFAIEVATVIQKLPRNTVNVAYCNQLIRSSSSPGTNYRAALRGKSTADFINKLKIVEEELDESLYFLDLLCHFNDPHRIEIEKLMKKSDELLAITISSIRTARSKLRTS